MLEHPSKNRTLKKLSAAENVKQMHECQDRHTCQRQRAMNLASLAAACRGVRQTKHEEKERYCMSIGQDGEV